MAPFSDDEIHPWWVRESRSLSSIVLIAMCAFFGGATLLITQFEFGQEAVANSGAPEDRPSVGLGDVSPTAPDVAPYWEPDHDHFASMPEPQPGDWLHRFDEPGQTVEEYFAQGPNAVTKISHVIYLQPLGDFDDDAPDLGVIAEYIELYFGLPTRILPAIDPQGRVAERRTKWAAGGKQYLTTDLMRP